MSDNFPFDFVIFYENCFYRCQVKTSQRLTENDSISFGLTSNNWHKGKIYKYNEDTIDIMICCDLNKIYIFPECDVNGKSNICIRESIPKNNQLKNINFVKDCILSDDRLKYTFEKIKLRPKH